MLFLNYLSRNVMNFRDLFLKYVSFRLVLLVSVVLRVALIVYSEWHDAHSVVKYTDVDYRVFSDAARFVWRPGRNLLGGPLESNYAKGPLASWLRVGECVVAQSGITYAH